MRTATPKSSEPASADRAGPSRILVVDDHHAVRLGIQMLLDDEPGIRVVASAGSYEEALELSRGLSPDVAVVDYHLPGRDGLALTRELVTEPDQTRALIFSAYADERLELAALIAGADGVLGKNVLGIELCHRIEVLSRGARPRFSVTPAALAAVGEELEVRDRPILGMLAAGTEPAEIAAVLRIDQAELDARRSAMLERLRGPAARRAPAPPPRPGSRRPAPRR
jgi:DNA-binding NarL/FixJ family response regulator